MILGGQVSNDEFLSHWMLMQPAISMYLFCKIAMVYIGTPQGTWHLVQNRGKSSQLFKYDRIKDKRTVR